MWSPFDLVALIASDPSLSRNNSQPRRRVTDTAVQLYAFVTLHSKWKYTYFFAIEVSVRSVQYIIQTDMEDAHYEFVSTNVGNDIQVTKSKFFPFG
jgi:hypothetical protein